MLFLIVCGVDDDMHDCGEHMTEDGGETVNFIKFNAPGIHHTGVD